MYSIRCDDRKFNKVKVKGIVKAYRERRLRHTFPESASHEEDDKCKILADQIVHNLKTVLVNKCSLNPNDCKRFVLPDGISTLVY